MEDFVHDIPQLSAEENVILTSPFTEKEVYDTISQMEHNKTPGLDGFPAEFYQMFWGVNKVTLWHYLISSFQGICPVQTEFWCYHFTSKNT
jgi:hypothetical protein